MAKDHLPTVLCREIEHTAIIGKSKYFKTGCDILIMDKAETALFDWIHFADVESADRLINALEMVREKLKEN